MVKKWQILQNFGKLKKYISAKSEKMGRSGPQNGFFTRRLSDEILKKTESIGLNSKASKAFVWITSKAFVWITF